LRLHRLRVTDLGAVLNADIAFGPGLNVLYGPNDLGKSTLADAIRLVLLLPHTSTHIEDYVPWTGGHDPVVEITFETEPQRIWRVRKEFRKGGTALLQESKNGVDFDDVERARKVDGRLRDLLRWGIPEPGGAGASRGLPTSFLATVLLSTQSDVTSVLNDSLQTDIGGTGRERIAAALQAVAQDPLFVALLKATQARRDEAFTDMGARKTAKGSVFKAAADRLNQVRDEKEKLQKVVDESEGVEKQLRDLTAMRGQLEETLFIASERLVTLDRLAAETANLAKAAEDVRIAREEVLRIQALGGEVNAAARTIEELAGPTEAAEGALKVARAQLAEADSALESAEHAVGASGSDPATAETVARQGLELRKAAADQASTDAQQQIERAIATQNLVDAAVTASREFLTQQAEREKIHVTLSETVAAERAAEEQLLEVDLLERACAARAAEEQASVAQAEVEKRAALQVRRDVAADEREALQALRTKIAVPSADALAPMRRLATDLAGAYGALNVGLVVTVTPQRQIDIVAKRDGTVVESTHEPLVVEARAEVELDIRDVATIRVRGGRRETQQTAELLAARWNSEVIPHLTAANVADLDGLTARIAEALDLDSRVTAKNTELQSIETQIAALVDSAEMLRDAIARRSACRAALGDVPVEMLASKLATLGDDPAAALRQRRQRLSIDLDLAREKANQVRTNDAIAEERTRTAGATLDAAVAARDTALATFPEGLATTFSAVRAMLATAVGEQLLVANEFSCLESTNAARKELIDSALRDARAAAKDARLRVSEADAVRTKAITDHALQVGRFEELSRLRDAQDLAAAEDALRDAVDRHAGAPVPQELVSETELAAAHDAKTTAMSDLNRIDREIQKTHGALGHVGGAVARERLRDANEAFELAAYHEREVEADYDAWLLLLEQMKGADAAQASNLGQVLAPAIAGRFEALTQRRYENIRLTAQLATEGVVVAGAVRSTDRISVGTRDQLSTLYRLSLAEYLCTAVVLDDQLVQSDDTRMDWFRALLTEKAHSFQIIVFTCRPSDYLADTAMAPEGNAVHNDTDGEFVRAVDLGRAVGRR
jgi:hypothetical protein